METSILCNGGLVRRDHSDQLTLSVHVGSTNSLQLTRLVAKLLFAAL